MLPDSVRKVARHTRIQDGVAFIRHDIHVEFLSHASEKIAMSHKRTIIAHRILRTSPSKRLVSKNLKYTCHCEAREACRGNPHR